MTKKLLNNMVAASYNKGNLDEETIRKISSYLDRKGLKRYIRALKMEERKRTILIDIPFEGEQYHEELQSLFPDKKFKYKTDPSLILGIRVTDNDMVYEMNMKNSLDRMMHYIEEQI